ncbi:unnamed protein product [Chrysoparadoxa australica]
MATCHSPLPKRSSPCLRLPSRLVGSSFSREDDRSAVGASSHFGDQAAEAASMLNAGGSLSSKLLLSISCDSLANMDTTSLSDPFVVVSLRSVDGNWIEVARTEIVANSLSPRFVHQIPMEYRFEEVQHLKFAVYDCDSDFSTADAKSLDLSKQDFQGSAECALALIVGGRGQQWTGQLSGGETSLPQGTITVRAEEVASQNMLLTVQLEGKLHHKRNAFIRISKVSEGNQANIPCYKTEVSMGTSLPVWAPIQAPLSVIANGDVHRPLELEVFSWQKDGDHEYIGSASVSISDMQSRTHYSVHITKPSKKSSMGLKNKGELVVRGISLVPKPSFFDYIAGGLELQFACAIDYTASNGDPARADSLHYVDPRGTLNQYATAITSVGQVLEFYDTDKKFPLFGFGGRPSPSSQALHCFPVNGNEGDPEVIGVRGILDAYYGSLRTILLSGPTLFAPIITQVATLAASAVSNDPSHQQYWTLMIITDGVINDMSNTMDALVAAADLPFSVIIVGVGQQDFTNMEQLDGDDERLQNSAGKFASRDCVQFVPMRDLVGQGHQALARCVLAELPGQVVEYYQMRGMNPASPRLVPRGSSLGDVLTGRQASFRASQAQGQAQGQAERPLPPPPPPYSVA